MSTVSPSGGKRKSRQLSDLTTYLRDAGLEAQRQYEEHLASYLRNVIDGLGITDEEFFDNYYVEEFGPTYSPSFFTASDDDTVSLKTEFKFRVRRKTDEEWLADCS